MRLAYNGVGHLILWLRDGTEIIFSHEATERIDGDENKALLELMRMVIHQ